MLTPIGAHLRSAVPDQPRIIPVPRQRPIGCERGYIVAKMGGLRPIVNGRLRMPVRHPRCEGRRERPAGPNAWRVEP